MRIALLTDGIFPFVLGGMGKHSRFLAEWLTRLGAEVTVFHPGEPGKGKPSGLQAGFETVFIPWPLKRGPGHYIRENREYASAIESHIGKGGLEFDLIYAQGLTGWSLLKSRGGRPPVMVNLHGLEMFQRASGLRDRLVKSLLIPPVKFQLRNADAVVSLGGRLGELLIGQGVPKEKIFTLPVGIDPDWLKTGPDPIKKKGFVFLGRYEFRKGLDLLHEALQELSKENIHPPFTVIGPVPEEKKIRLGNVSYTGRLDEPEVLQRALENAAWLVVPSRAEGMPTVILEAFSKGTPAIATEVGAVSELVGKGTGLLIPPGNLERLKEAIRNAESMSAGKFAEISSAARSKAAYYSWDRVAGMHLEAFSVLLSRF